MALLLPLRDARIPLLRLTGIARATGREASIVVAGAERWARYLPERYFAGAPRREPLGHTVIWSLRRRLEACDADVTITRVHRRTMALLGGDWLCVPEWVGSIVRIPIELDLLAAASNSVAEDLRRTRRRGWVAELRRDEASFDAFYRSMFVPYIRARHGADAYVLGVRALRRSFRRGGVLWLSLDGKPAAGAAFEQRGDGLAMTAIGTADGEQLWRERGALAALYVHMFEYARRCGARTVDLRGMRASLNDGLVRYKAKWGAEIYERTGDSYAWHLQWRRFDDTVAALLAAVPLIVRDSGGLSGLAVVERREPWTSDALQATCERLWLSGLARLCIVSDAARADDLRLPPRVRLVERATVRDGGTRALRAALGAA